MANTKTKQDMEVRKASALRLFINGESQKDIAKLVGVSEPTLSRWAASQDWEKKRREYTTSTASLANSMMAAARQITELIIGEIQNKGKAADIASITKLSDNLVKVMAAAERIAKAVSKEVIVDVLITHERWLMRRADTDGELTREVITLINKYHREYIKELEV